RGPAVRPAARQKRPRALPARRLSAHRRYVLGARELHGAQPGQSARLAVRHSRRLVVRDRLAAQLQRREVQHRVLAGRIPVPGAASALGRRLHERVLTRARFAEPGSATRRKEHSMNTNDLERWLNAYGEAWEKRDADAVVKLFKDDALYYETPYADPFRGRVGIRNYWSNVTADQRELNFESKPL